MRSPVEVTVAATFRHSTSSHRQRRQTFNLRAAAALRRQTPVPAALCRGVQQPA
jgi:hypothetical protein